MARKSSPGLDLNHGFFHMIRRHQLTEAKHMQENRYITKTAHKKIQELNSVSKGRYPETPLYVAGINGIKLYCHTIEGFREKNMTIKSSTCLSRLVRFCI